MIGKTQDDSSSELKNFNTLSPLIFHDMFFFLIIFQSFTWKIFRRCSQSFPRKWPKEGKSNYVFNSSVCILWCPFLNSLISLYLAEGSPPARLFHVVHWCCWTDCSTHCSQSRSSWYCQVPASKCPTCHCRHTRYRKVLSDSVKPPNHTYCLEDCLFCSELPTCRTWKRKLRWTWCCRGQTALQVAAAAGRRSVCCLLVAAGASLAVRDRQGRTAKQLALQANDSELAHYLESK